MGDQSQSLDTFLQLNQDFCVPDQLFEDSDIGVEDIDCNTVEIETSEGDSYKTENVVKDGGDVMMTSTAAPTPVYNPLPAVTINNNSVNNQDHVPLTAVSQGGSILPTTLGTASQATMPMVSQIPMVTHSLPVPLVTPAVTKHAPLKMVSVPVNSDLITQGNSQVVLIPMGGMDSSKLESALKVPFGQKLVIIKPQEILKTIEEKKSQKVQQNPGVVGITVGQARNLAMTQQGIILQSTTQGGFQQIPMSQVGKLAMVGSGLATAQKCLVKVASKGVPILPSIQRPVNSSLTTQVPKATNISGMPTVKSAIARPVGQNPSNSTIQPQVMRKQIAKPPGQIGGVSTSQQFITNKQVLKPTAQSVVTGDSVVQPQVIPIHISNSSNQLGSTTLANTSQTSLTVQQQSATAGLEVSSSVSPNLYQTLKQKLNKGGSTPNHTNTANVNQNIPQGLKPPVNIQSNTQSPNQNVQNTSTTKTPQKVIVTYVPPQKAAPKVDISKTSGTTCSRSGAVIQIPAKLEVNELQQQSTSERGGNVINVSNGSVAKALLSPSSSEQQPKMIPRITPQPNWPSISHHEATLKDVVVKKRGRPKNDAKSVSNTQNIKNPLSGPSLKHELERKDAVSSGRLKTVKPSEHQMKTVKYKRVSNTNPWTCALCGKVSFANSLGCLYGPYNGESDVVKEGDDTGEGDEPQQKRRRGSSEDGSPRKSGTGEDLWFHGDCIVWSPGVYALGESLAGYKQVVTDAQSRMCNTCGSNGATLVCLQRACKKQYHFFCAKKTGCVFEESNYSIQCGKHTK